MAKIPPHIEALLHNAKRIYCQSSYEAMSLSMWLDEQMRCVCDYERLKEGFTPMLGKSVVDQLLHYGPWSSILPVVASTSTSDPYLRNADVKIFDGETYVNMVALVTVEHVEKALAAAQSHANFYEVYFSKKLREELAAC